MDTPCDTPVVKQYTVLFWLGFAGVVALAFLMRFYRLADLPAGLHYDEAFNALDAHALLSLPLSRWPLFFLGNFGREPLLNYLLAAAQTIAGPSLPALRTVTALIGALLTPALVWLAWEVAPALERDRRRLSLWTGMAVLGLLWSQIFARYLIRVEFFALLETLFLAALWRGWRTNRLRWFVVAGVFGGLAFYTYLPVRLLPLIFVPSGIILLLRDRAALQRRRAGLASTVLIALFAAAPLLLFFARNPAAFSQRVDQVSLFNKPPELLENAVSVAGMFLVSGDANPRNNLPGRPALDWTMAVPFVLGLLGLLRRANRPARLLLLSWFGVMLLPTVLSEYAPSFQRAIGAMPAVALFIAIGLDRVVSWFATGRPRMAVAVTHSLSVLVLVSIALTWQAFSAWSADPEVFFARDEGFVQVGEHLRTDQAGGIVYLSPRGGDHPTLQYALLGVDEPPTLRGFSGPSCVRVSDIPNTRYIFLDQEDGRGPALTRSYLPDAQDRALVTDPYGRAWATELIQPPDGRIIFPEMTTHAVSWQNGPHLLGYWLSAETFTPGDRLFVRLFWRTSVGMSRQDLTAFVHLLNRAPDQGGEVVAGLDAQPGRGSCATSTWQDDETIVDELELVVPADLEASDYFLEIGLYNTETGVRVSIAGAHSDITLIGPLQRSAP